MPCSIYPSIRPHRPALQQRQWLCTGPTILWFNFFYLFLFTYVNYIFIFEYNNIYINILNKTCRLTDLLFSIYIQFYNIFGTHNETALSTVLRVLILDRFFFNLLNVTIRRICGLTYFTIKYMRLYYWVDSNWFTITIWWVMHLQQAEECIYNCILFILYAPDYNLNFQLTRLFIVL